MILTVDELRKYFDTDETDAVLAVWLEAMTQMVHMYTNNSFREYAVDGVLVYPADVKMGVVNLLKWEFANRNKAGIASETISRHSVTYRSDAETNYINGYPASLMGFLKPYMKARFGQRGVMV
ncbi:MAG: hypothetical protein PUD63_02260 [Clostridia bacterium]|nr:hypothetical protein [Clostridia bacterium]